ncbi:MAG TPA: TolC family protein [Flavitalea sp.]|nr:TolC family protein [Flavitalea sp.]
MLKYFPFLLLLLMAAKGNSQVLTVKNAVQTALTNYASIKAKASYLKASEASVKQATLEYLPGLNVGAQQSYGTINGQFGPVFAIGGLNTASAGPPFQKQNWNAAFGSLYLANINWNFFSFGRVREHINLARAELLRGTDDLEQEKFQHQVRVAGAYLNLLAAQRLRVSQQRNLDRAKAFRDVVVARTQNGLNPGVDTSLANAEFSNAKIALTNAVDFEQEQTSRLAELMGITTQEFSLDTVLINRIPGSTHDSSAVAYESHPLLKYYQSRINVSNQQEKYYQRFKYPVFSLIGIIQSKGSGFHQNYNELSPDAITHDYWNGTKPTRGNYLLGVGVSWNLTDITRIDQQVAAQHWISSGLHNEYEQINQQIRTQVQLAEQKMNNAISNYNEAPIQMKAATDAFHQRSVLFKNGLTDIVDVTQALYTLNRAETNRDIAITNVWQALLLKAAASGDFGLFINEF